MEFCLKQSWKTRTDRPTGWTTISHFRKNDFPAKEIISSLRLWRKLNIFLRLKLSWRPLQLKVLNFKAMISHDTEKPLIPGPHSTHYTYTNTSGVNLLEGACGQWMSKRVHKVQKIEVHNSREACGVGSRGPLKGLRCGPGGEVLGNSGLFQCRSSSFNTNLYAYDCYV